MICCLGFVIFKQTYMHRISMLRMKNDALSKITNKYQGKGSIGADASASGSKGSGCQSRELKMESAGSSPKFPEDTGQPSLPRTSHHSARDRSDSFSKPIAGTSCIQAFKRWKPPPVWPWPTGICTQANLTFKEDRILLESWRVTAALFQILRACLLSFFEQQIHGPVLLLNSLKSKVNEGRRKPVFSEPC